MTGRDAFIASDFAGIMLVYELVSLLVELAVQRRKSFRRNRLAVQQ